MKVTKARPIRRSKEAEDEKEQIEETEEHKESEENKNLAFSGDTKLKKLSNFLNRQKTGFDKWMMERRERQERLNIERRKEQELETRAENLLSAYGDTAMKRLDNFPEEAREEIIDIITQFKSTTKNVKDKFQREILKLSDSEEILFKKDEMKTEIDEIKNDFINEIITIFKKIEGLETTHHQKTDLQYRSSNRIG